MDLAFSIRMIRAADHQAVLDIYAPYIVHTPISFEYEVPALPDFSARIGEVSSFYPWLVAETGGQVAGYAYASRHRGRTAYDWSVEVSVYLEGRYHRQGLATRLYTTLFRILRLQGIVNAYAGIALPNAPSESFHATMGFQSVGVYRQVGYKSGRWHDVLWMALSLQEHVQNPAPPQSIRMTENTPGFASVFG